MSNNFSVTEMYEGTNFCWKVCSNDREGRIFELKFLKAGKMYLQWNGKPREWRRFLLSFWKISSNLLKIKVQDCELSSLCQCVHFQCVLCQSVPTPTVPLPLTSQSLKDIWAPLSPSRASPVRYHHVTYGTKSKFLRMMLEDLLQLNLKFSSQATSFCWMSSSNLSIKPDHLPCAAHLVHRRLKHGHVRFWASCTASTQCPFREAFPYFCPGITQLESTTSEDLSTSLLEDRTSTAV